MKNIFQTQKVSTSFINVIMKFYFIIRPIKFKVMMYNDIFLLSDSLKNNVRRLQSKFLSVKSGY